MDVEEAKRIIEDKIQADEAIRKIRKQIKTYTHEKQNAREGFTETFKPLIETSEKVKESVDTQQNKLIKQLQENQLALTQGLEGNRLAITSGFDKMELDQPQVLEAIEEPEMEKEYKEKLEMEKEYKEKLEKLQELKKQYETQKKLIKQYEINKKLEEEKEKSKKTTFDYKKENMDRYLNNKESIDLLNFYGLKLPSKYKDLSLGELQKAFEKGMDEAANLKKSIRNVAEYKTDTITGLLLAYPIKGQQSKEKSKELIKEYNIMQIFINNMGELRNYKKITGMGIIHFNNPQQLVSRLELLAGSIIAGNNGVKQEFSQIAHLLHQLKVITKKTLNDLLKKYILLK